MRFANYLSVSGPRLGAIVDSNLIDVNSAYASYLQHIGSVRVKERADFEVPSNTVSFIAGGPATLQCAETAIQHALEHPGHYLMSRESVTLTKPIDQPSKVICLGLNYMDHAAETKSQIPEYPVLFGKYASTLAGPEDDIVIPRVSSKVDYEGELAVIIGKQGRYVPKEDAMNYVFGYTILNDITIRDYQKHTKQWTAGKIFDQSTPVGPEIVTADELKDPHHLDLEVRVNGITLQKANTCDMMFKIPETIAYISDIVQLQPGDIIAMGTPSGIGATRQPPIFLKSGDNVTVTISQLGELRNRITE